MSSSNYDPRFTTLIFSVIAAIAAGTLYIYGVYSPQLIHRCKLSAESAATISFASNLGSGLGGFPAGMIIDRFGVQISLIVGAMCILGGYGSLYQCYKVAHNSIIILSIGIFFVGFGSIISYYSTLKVCTSNFPNHRGTAGAFAVSSFGLSALIFSAISAYWFSGDVQGLLRFLSLTCGTIIAFSSIFIKLYSEEEIELLQSKDEEEQIVQGLQESSSSSSSTGIERSQPKVIDKPKTSSLGPLLGAHRGSLAQINFNQSTSSLFSYASSLMSRSSASISSLSVSSSSPDASNRPIQVRPPNSNSINNINNTYFNSSPTSSRLSNSPGTFGSSSPMDRAPLQHRDSLSKGVYFGLGGASPRNSFSSPESALLKKEVDSSTAPVKAPLPVIVDEETPLIETAKPLVINKLKKSKKHHSATGHLKNLLTNRLFLLHYLLVGIISSIGQLYVYSIGFVVTALYNKKDVVALASTQNSSLFIEYLLKNKLLMQSLNGLIFNYFGLPDIGSLALLTNMANNGSSNSDSTAEAYQALQVSILAFGSFAGRLLWGPLSDMLHRDYKCQRLWLVVLSTILLIFGQIAVIVIDDITKISIASILFGVGYGSIFSVYPAVIADQFGSNGFTTSWGLICTGPLVGLYFLTKVFGQTIDKMSEFIDGEYICIVGNRCYNEIFKIDIGLCIFVCFVMLGLIYQKRHEK